jgi:pantetheine-phosphate adenylyltransferase
MNESESDRAGVGPCRSSDPSRTAVFTGTFDPLTLGHLDVIRRGRLLFEHLVVGIGVNPNKSSLFTIEERVELSRQVVAPYRNVSVESFEELTVQFVRRIGARVILRGVRTLSDMEYEFGMSLTNHRLDPFVETVFLMADGEYSHVSSSLIKQVARYGGADSLGLFVPPELIGPIAAKMAAVREREGAGPGQGPGRSNDATRSLSDDGTAIIQPL